MTGRTHLSVGMAATLIVLRPMTLPAVATCIGGALIGSVISDIDVKTSNARDVVNRVLGIVVLFMVIEGFINYRFQMNILNLILEQSSVYHFISGMAVFIVACIICKELPHRSFMHSAIGVFSFSLIVYYIFPDMMLPFAIAFVSHIMLDMLNKKEVRVWYPLKKGISLNLCKSNGWISNILFLSGILVCGGYFYFVFHSNFTTPIALSDSTRIVEYMLEQANVLKDSISGKYDWNMLANRFVESLWVRSTTP